MAGGNRVVTVASLDYLTSVSRVLIRASLVLFTGGVLVLIQSAFWSTRVSAWMQAIILATALLSYFRPHYGLLALAALAPLGQLGSSILNSQMRGTEALVLAFLSGALVREWTLRELRTFPSQKLHVVTLIFGFVVAASLFEQIWLMQIRRDFAWPFLQEVLTYASRNYLTSFQGFQVLFRAMLLLEGLALLICVIRYAEASARFARQLAAMLVVGALATATLTFMAASGDFMAMRQTGASFVDFFARGRWSGHIVDVNAAGSYFAMTAFLATGIGFNDRKWRRLWLSMGAVLFVAMFLTGSRTAVAATGFVVVPVLLRFAASYPSYAIRILSAAGAAAAIATAVFLIFRTTGAPPTLAVTIRLLFLQTTANMLVAEPVFGVGIGQYIPRSAHFAPPVLLEIFRPDNAHNNLAQIAGELGLLGLTTFLLVLAVSFSTRSNTRDANQLRGPLIAGLAAFILTWLGGHPMLIAEVAYPFWIALSLAAAIVARDSRENVSAGTVGLAIVLLLVSIPFRVGAKSTDFDLTNVTYGVSAKQLMTSRARFFVPGSESRVDIPLRAHSVSEGAPVEIEVIVDGSASESITLSDRNWRRAPIDLPRDPSRRFHQIDLFIRPHALDNVDPDRSSVEVGKWEIISKPNG